MRYLQHDLVMKRMNKRLLSNKIWKIMFMIVTSFAMIALVILLYRIVSQGLSYLDFDFLMNFASRIPENAGIKAALVGSLWLMSVVAPVSIVIGVGTAIYLEEYARQNRINLVLQRLPRLM